MLLGASLADTIIFSGTIPLFMLCKHKSRNWRKEQLCQYRTEEKLQKLWQRNTLMTSARQLTWQESSVLLEALLKECNAIISL